MPVDVAAFRPDAGRVLACEAGQRRTEYIERASGLRLVVTEQGARTWCVVFYSRVAGFSRRLRLGDAAAMPLAQARAAARAALHLVETEGRDPHLELLAERDREREARRLRKEERRREREDRRHRQLTVAELVAKYVAHRQRIPSGKYGRVVRPHTVALWRGIIKHHVVPAIGDRFVETVKAGDVLNVLEGAVARGGPTMGPRVRDFLGAVWRWAALRSDRLGATVAPIAFSSLPRVGSAQQERERALSPAEIWRLWRATETAGPQGLGLRLMLLTATRVREVLALPWAELELDRGTWKLPAERNKSARDRTIPLSKPAVELLRARRAATKHPLVFGPVPRVNEVMMARVRAGVGGDQWEPRDLRRTAATLCARLGADPFTVSLLLGHAKADERVPAVSRIYLRWDYANKVREALERLGAWIEETVSLENEPGGDVVSIEARR